MAEKNLIHVKIVTPNGSVNNANSGSHEFDCDSIIMNAQEGERGGGGSFGVHYGHIDAIAALAKGKTTAYLDGKIVKTLLTGDGFAKITRDSVTILTDGYTVVEKQK